MQLLNGEQLIEKYDNGLRVSHLPKRHAHAEMKWTSLFLPDSEFAVLDAQVTGQDIMRLGDYAQVDVGIFTGRNKFFVISEDEANSMRVNGYSVSVVGRTSALKSISFTHDDSRLYAKKYPSRLLNLKGVAEEKFSKKLIEYI